jgi:hypothetical protein
MEMKEKTEQQLFSLFLSINLFVRAFRKVQILGDPTDPAVTRTKGYASNGFVGSIAQLLALQRLRVGGIPFTGAT